MSRPRSVALRCQAAAGSVQVLSTSRIEGRTVALSGLAIDVAGLASHASVGTRVTVSRRGTTPILAEVVGFSEGVAHAMAFGAIDGVGSGVSARMPLRSRTAHLRISHGWLGRVIDPLGRPLDGLGAVPTGNEERPARCAPPQASTRARVGLRLDLGIRVLNVFATCCEGQRLGLFAGSGVGKSSLLAMLARNAACDVAVVALVGERGREVRQFLEDEMGPNAMAKTVVIVATSDTSPVMRRESAYTAMTVAEYFRDQGKSVLLLMDSITRFCSALREIGLASGESPATRGYPPSVFAELPRLLERAGPGFDGPGPVGQITAFFTVLVEGDDHNEPVADAVRGILDGHVILDRKIAEGGRYPAVDVLRSLSRLANSCNSEQENRLIVQARRLMATFAEVADLVRLGAYRAGTDPLTDQAISVNARIEAMLTQSQYESSSIQDSFESLKRILN